MAEKNLTPSHGLPPVSLQRGTDNAFILGRNFSVTPLVQVHPEASRDDVIALATARIDDVQTILDLLLDHTGDVPVARIAGLLSGMVEDVSALLNAAARTERWTA